jgi:hypothetical protein
MRFTKPVLSALALVGAACSLLPGTVLAQSSSAPLPEPVPIEEWSQAKVIAMGQAIYQQDTASWRATDALVGALGQNGIGTVRGWLVVPSGANQKVRFLKASGDGVEAGWDIIVADGRAGAVVPATEPLTTEEQAQWAARQTAAANIGSLRCSATLNNVVIKDPDGDGWLVWLLTSTNDANVVPMGGHYRFHISADGQSVLRRDQLSNSCLSMSKQIPERGAQPKAIVVSQIVSAGPVETHVFLSLQNRMPIYVMASDKMFAVDGMRIRDASAALRR